MRQTITKTQFNDLPANNKKVLNDWIQEREYSQELTIGQMIEFMHDKLGIEIYPLLTDVVGRFLDDLDLADALWESLKEKINE